MAFGTRICFSGNQSFYKSVVLFENDAAIFAGAFILIRLSGVFEIVLGILLLAPKFTRLAAWGLIALLIAVFPANVFMAMNANLFPEFSQTALYLRLPVQIVLIAWAFWFTRRDNNNNL